LVLAALAAQDLEQTVMILFFQLLHQLAVDSEGVRLRETLGDRGVVLVRLGVRQHLLLLLVLLIKVLLVVKILVLQIMAQVVVEVLVA
jgi:hypothetical protein